ncbi:hypothetical protein ACGFZP_22030 [Kitasatospora sp. NPDC048239]|uniref:hypothetical protein n=1 Tax=Kitasatospora sp. NPDC048239 TaxID=3364046 RepID=UPI0037108B73
MIEPHVRGVIKRSLNHAAASPGSILNLSDGGSVWAGTGMGFFPWFRPGSGGRLECPQEPVLGLSLVRAAIRGALISTRSILAGDHLSEGRFNAASSALYYTAAFHALDGLLATRGRVLIQPARGQIRSYSHDYGNGSTGHGMTHDPLPGDPAVICGSISRKATWSYEPRGRTHQSRWSELKQLTSTRGATLPDYVARALSYAAGTGPEIQGVALLERGIPALALLRHQALYEGFGYDADAFDAVMNRDNPYGMGLDSRADHLRELAVGLLDDCLEVADFFVAWAEGSPDSSSVVTRVVLSALMPAFEFESRSLRTLEPETAAKVDRLAALLTTGKVEPSRSPA